MKRLKKILIALTSLFSVVALFPLSACSGGKMHTLTLVNENEDGGRLTGGGSFKTGSQVTVSYSANKGYKFDHWDIDGETIKISSKAYTFKMPNKDITVKGNFLAKQYKVEISNSNNSTVTGAGTYAYNSEVTVTCTPNKGYEFVSWYDETDKSKSSYVVSNEPVYTFKMPDHDIRLWDCLRYIEYSVTIVNSDPENVNVYTSGQKYHYDSKITLNVVYIGTERNVYYECTGIYLYDNGVIGEKISDYNVFTMPDHDITIYVKVERVYSFYIAYFDENISAQSTWYPEGKEIKLNTLVPEYTKFIGWYDVDKEEYISRDLEYTYVMPNHRVTIYSRFEFDNDSFISLGSFQQSAVKDSNLIDELEKIETLNSRGYLEYEGNEYFKDTSKTNTSDYKYFKVEPIRWLKVKEFNDGTTMLLSMDLLTFGQVQESDLANGPFNYVNSSFREYLNNSFYDNTFTDEEKSKIQTVTIDNLISTIKVDDPSLSSSYITDKVFIPCRNDLDLPTFQSPFRSYLFAGLSTDYSICHTSINNTTIGDNHFETNLKTASSLLRNVTPKGELLCDYSMNDNLFLNEKVGSIIALRPMIFVKGLNFYEKI